MILKTPCDKLFFCDGVRYSQETVFLAFSIASLNISLRISCSLVCITMPFPF